MVFESLMWYTPIDLGRSRMSLSKCFLRLNAPKFHPEEERKLLWL